MLISPDLSFSRTLPLDIFNQLGELLEQMAQAVEGEFVVLTEAVLKRITIPEEWQTQRFTVVISKGFSALMVGFPEQKGDFGEQLDVKFTFSCEAIASFLTSIRDLFVHNSPQHQKIDSVCQLLAPNDVKLQSQFTLLLLDFFLPQLNQEVTQSQASTTPVASVCQPVEDALNKQLAQERLLNQITTRTRQSLDLSVIMVTAIEQVRKFLELDRLVICKLVYPQVAQLYNDLENVNNNNLPSGLFSPENSLTYVRQSKPTQVNYPSLNGRNFGFGIPNFSEEKNHASDFSSSLNLGQSASCVIYESRIDETIPSVLNYREEYCFVPNSPWWEKYRQGFTVAVDDIEKTYALEECLLNFLRNIKVRSKFIAPIVFEDQLWGLLIAHQCNTPHNWNENEKSLLTSVAEQLAIAIHQAELMRSLTQEKQTLEQRVVERTVALHDALVAAEAASRLRSEFLATISHELLTPLTYVIGMSATLLRWSFGDLNQRQREYLQTIHDSGEHLLEMINDILDLSQIEAGKAVLNITEFSLVKVSENIVASLLEKATSQQVSLRLELLVDQKGDNFTADVRRVEQILWNLLSNAIKFTPEGGNVTLRLWMEYDTAVFQVEDTGIGIPQEQLPLLFEKFHQLDTPYRRRYEGTGLGLALTKQLVELHRGRIEVESSVGVGSIFTVWIPVQPESVMRF
ncbi:MAG: GAF domain-containing sensor histidine kinase [Pelatocladus maniniholoensis HA4357-MV3]|jgi:two-component system sensor histidine kinase/response regulator|uniref:histidine kinase n=1 Tax=Pelatocladus maniniholoensis HA4357-MV3 TaxID=1117104 RepID=A0A9E3HBJ4_9NOST|nr:GAF domain-containing sensor histidine kinase [Pelatocladus maniniholoensis HA4357-MV3]BAZ68781.1 GAF sensor signal transduction histidine kinase [Fischerella sp. NIES-4106]